MAIAMVTKVSQATLDQYDAVNAKIGLGDDPPEGLIVHAAASGEAPGFVILEVWESSDAYERFASERLGPAIAEVTQGQAGEPDREVYQLHNLIKP
jgi:hypothetical protein